MQLQVSCLSREEILDAMAHPENYRSLVVRIGGYSEYFTRLTPELQQTVLERTEH
jgi:formate C-acetyltransferase